jgi:hypothetical protein
MSEMRCIDAALRLFHTVCQKGGPPKPAGTEMKRDTRTSVFAVCVNVLCKDANVIKEGTYALLDTCRGVNVEANENGVYIHVLTAD